MQSPVLDIDTKLGKQDGGIVDKSLLMMHLAAYLLLAGIGQPFGEDAGIGYCKACDNLRGIVGQTEIVGFAKQLVLVILSLVVEEIID